MRHPYILTWGSFHRWLLRINWWTPHWYDCLDWINSIKQLLEWNLYSVSLWMLFNNKRAISKYAWCIQKNKTRVKENFQDLIWFSLTLFVPEGSIEHFGAENRRKSNTCANYDWIIWHWDSMWQGNHQLKQPIQSMWRTYICIFPKASCQLCCRWWHKSPLWRCHQWWQTCFRCQWCLYFFLKYTLLYVILWGLTNYYITEVFRRPYKSNFHFIFLNLFLVMYYCNGSSKRKVRTGFMFIIFFLTFGVLI